jgi:hypothetical protein
VKTKHAAQIRAGILEARKWFPNVSGMSTLTWEAFCRESNNYLKRLLKEPNPFV